ncbi:MAG: 4-(cytidine 5'-diphospho)-2-C-methyl-D-erythritol kinase [Alphaproteobacteria bacterium]|nr:4-(cytidine 5'-diphospho)-2-C-methyl-D-erythritol kinase [Alphaproteobacteria bacterium]|tara:strand:+ start:3252 stop:4157 length:906 start_codon:yes stop_codon:yes gene_type:complete
MAIDPSDGGKVVRCRAPAKINLYLHVLGRRSDGYHDIDSLIVFAGVSDQVSVSRSQRPGLRMAGPFAHDMETMDWANNLVVVAARALSEVCGESPSVALSLQKNLPVAAGLGGGSSDAAATLRALAELWTLDISDEQLRAVAEGLGADVPACLAQNPVAISGRGEIITQAPKLPAAWLVLANPGIPLVTAEVFRWFSPTGSQAAPLKEAPKDLGAMVEALARRSNDLEQPAITLVPQIAEVIEMLSTSEGCMLARMSGSGATCFGIFSDEASADAAAESIGNEQDTWWVSSVQMLRPGLAQ